MNTEKQRTTNVKVNTKVNETAKIETKRPSQGHQNIGTKHGKAKENKRRGEHKKGTNTQTKKKTRTVESNLVIPNAHLSNIGLLPKLLLGLGRGWLPVMNTLSLRGVWFPPRPLLGGTPIRRVGAG